jgi:hypothetical protein
MVAALSQIQVQVTSELQKIGSSAVYACEQLSTYGLYGDQARQILAALVANSSYIVDAGTVDLSNTMITVAPAAYQHLKATT